MSARRHGSWAAVEVGDSWAYRARGVDPLVEVSVVRIGIKKPARVLVRFTADEFEGREDWVPPTRLKAPWPEAGDFTARERRWQAAVDASPIRDTAADYASSHIFDALVPIELATTGNNSATGVSRIRDVDGLAAFLGLHPATLRASALSFVEDGALVVPWAITELIASTAARRHPDPILREVEQSEAEHQQKTAYGQTLTDSDAHLDADWFAQQLDQPYNRPYWELLRSWCGSQAVERRDELVLLRQEVTRVGKLAQEAIAALREVGQERLADRLGHGLGTRVDEITQH